MKPIIYKSIDAGAPQLSATSGAMNAVIKACLVTGYGDKLSAGWEVVYEDVAAHKMAICSTNIKSIKSTLRLVGTNPNYTLATAYKTWSKVTNTGGESFGEGFFVNMWGTSTPNWVVIATDSFFYLFVQMDTDSAETRVMSGFGDAISLMASSGVSVLLASPDVVQTEVNTGYYSVSNSLDIAAKFPLSVFSRDTSNGWGDRSASGSNRSISSLTIFSRFPLYCVRDGKNQPTIELMGMLMPYSEISGHVKGSDDIERLSGQNPYVEPLLGMYQPYHGRVWLQVDDWG